MNFQIYHFKKCRKNSEAHYFYFLIKTPIIVIFFAFLNRKKIVMVMECYTWFISSQRSPVCQLKCEHKRVNSIIINVILRFKYRFVRFLRYLSFLNFQILNSKLLFFFTYGGKKIFLFVYCSVLETSFHSFGMQWQCFNSFDLESTFLHPARNLTPHITHSHPNTVAAQQRHTLITVSVIDININNREFKRKLIKENVSLPTFSLLF